MHICSERLEKIALSRVYGVRDEGNVDPAGDIQGELTSQNVLFLQNSVREAWRDLGVS